MHWEFGLSSTQIAATERREADAPFVVSLLLPELRHVIESASIGIWRCIHAESLNEAGEALRQHASYVVLVSPDAIRRDSIVRIRRFASHHPGVRIIAVLGMNGISDEQGLLQLGAAGVRDVANLAEREGWNKLRALVSDAEDPLMSCILPAMLGALTEATPKLKQFFGEIVRLAPRTATVRELSRALGMSPSTLTSRFYRAGLPSPKLYLAMMRLVHAAAYLERSEVSIADVAYRLSFSSPQSFGRHVRVLLGLTAGEFRREVSFERALSHYTERLLQPYAQTFAAFEPLGPGAIAIRHRYPMNRDVVRMTAEKR